MEKKIEEIKIFMETMFVPAMKELFKEHSPEKYEEYQGNCCRQVAVFGCHLLSNLLPDIEWNAWQGEYKDKLFGKDVTYVHAWIYGKGDKRFLIDMARSHKENLFIETQGNRYPKDHPDYKDMIENWREKLDWRSMFKETEYLTGLPSYKVMGLIADKVLKMEVQKRMQYLIYGTTKQEPL
jgi:hypothetical protein